MPCALVLTILPFVPGSCRSSIFSNSLRPACLRLDPLEHRRRGFPVLELREWLKQVVSGFFHCHAMPTEGRALSVFRHRPAVQTSAVSGSAGRADRAWSRCQFGWTNVLSIGNAIGRRNRVPACRTPRSVAFGQPVMSLIGLGSAPYDPGRPAVRMNKTEDFDRANR